MGASGKRENRGRESERESHERQCKKMPVNFYWCVMKVRWMQKEGTRERAVTFFSLSVTPSCRCQLPESANSRLKVPTQTEQPRLLYDWSGSKSPDIIHTCKCLWGSNTVYVWVKLWTTNSHRNPIKSHCGCLCVSEAQTLKAVWTWLPHQWIPFSLKMQLQ